MAEYRLLTSVEGATGTSHIYEYHAGQIRKIFCRMTAAIEPWWSPPNQRKQLFAIFAFFAFRMAISRIEHAVRITRIRVVLSSQGF